MTEADREEHWEPTCQVDELRKGRLVEHLSQSILIVLAWVDDQPWAGSGLCPHQFARLSEGRIQDGRLHCARHQASFCMQSGAPDDRWQIDGIKIFETRIKNGIVEIKLGDQT